MQLKSPVFKNNGFLVSKYTCDSININPPLMIKNVPKNAQSLALVIDDIDAPAGIFTHWLVWNIDVNTKEIPENFVPLNSVEGITSWGKSGYSGPCPHTGVHRYFFKLFALDIKLDLSPKSDISEFSKTIKNHIIAKSELIGKYPKK